MIVLVGAPGVGKTTVGRLVADALDLEFIDVDALIVESEQREIADIFANDGEAAFRALEEVAACTVLAEPQRAVVSLGGGAVMNARIRAALEGHQVVWLTASPGTAAKRVGLNVARPLLLGNVRGRLAKLLEERLPLYRSVATVEIATDDLTVEQVRETVLAALQEQP